MYLFRIILGVVILMPVGIGNVFGQTPTTINYSGMVSGNTTVEPMNGNHSMSIEPGVQSYSVSGVQIS